MFFYYTYIQGKRDIYIHVCLCMLVYLHAPNSFHFTTLFLLDIYLLVIVIEGDPKVPFSIATTPRCRGGRYTFPWITPLYL